MAIKLFATSDRAASHAKLEEILAEGLHPAAECREDGAGEFSVWDGPEIRLVDPPVVTVAEKVVALFPDEVLDALADKLAVRLAAIQKKG